MRAVNLIPHDQRRGAGGIAGRSGGIVYVVAGGLIVIVALGIVYAFAVHSVASRKGELAQVTQQVGTVQTQTAALQPYVQVAQLRQASVSEAVTLAESRFNWPTAMQQIALALPQDVTLTSFAANAASSSSSTDASGAPAGVPIFTLTGCASSQSETALVLSRLQQTPGVTDVTLSTTAKVKDGAPNSAPPGTLSANLATNSTCPKVSFTLAVTYSPTYTLPAQKLPADTSTGAQTVSSSTSSTSTAQTTSTQPGTLTR